MSLFCLIIMITCIAEMFILFFAFYRNEWVLKARLNAISEEYLNQLPSYDYMFNHKFWVFDVKKFLKK